MTDSINPDRAGAQLPTVQSSKTKNSALVISIVVAILFALATITTATLGFTIDSLKYLQWTALLLGFVAINFVAMAYCEYKNITCCENKKKHNPSQSDHRSSEENVLRFADGSGSSQGERVEQELKKGSDITHETSRPSTATSAPRNASSLNPNGSSTNDLEPIVTKGSTPLAQSEKVEQKLKKDNDLPHETSSLSTTDSETGNAPSLNPNGSLTNDLETVTKGSTSSAQREKVEQLNKDNEIPSPSTANSAARNAASLNPNRSSTNDLEAVRTSPQSTQEDSIKPSRIPVRQKVMNGNSSLNASSPRPIVAESPKTATVSTKVSAAQPVSSHDLAKTTPKKPRASGKVAAKKTSSKQKLPSGVTRTRGIPAKKTERICNDANIVSLQRKNQPNGEPKKPAKAWR